MTHKKFRAVIAELGFETAYAAAVEGHLGVTIRQAHRYANGDSEVPRTLVLLLHMYQRHGLLSKDELEGIK